MARAAIQQERTRVRARDRCGLCGSRDLSATWSFGVTPLANAYLTPAEVGQVSERTAPLEVVRCTRCFLVQLKHVVDPEFLFGTYLYVSSTAPSFRQHFADYAQHLIERFSLTTDSLVVDVGSNDGVLLKPLQERGLRVLGIEPAQNIAAAANDQGIPTVPEFFSPQLAATLARAHGPAQVITANNVFAHTEDISAFTTAVKAWLANDGVFVFEVQYLRDLIEHNLFDIVYHEHLYYYHVAPLQRFLAGEGLAIFDVQRLPVHGGSLRVFVQRAGGPHKANAALPQFLADEAYLNDAAPYRAFAERVARNKEALRDLLVQLKREGKSIAGYGAPAKATTLLYAFGLNDATLDFIVDDSPFKQGRLMPGLHIPIVSSEELYRRRPAYCLVLAWNFAEAIAAQHARFTEQGGTFIIPVPTPRML